MVATGYLAGIFVSSILAGVVWSRVEARAEARNRPAMTAPRLAGPVAAAFGPKAKNELVLLSNGIEVDRWEMK